MALLDWICDLYITLKGHNSKLYLIEKLPAQRNIMAAGDYRTSSCVSIQQMLYFTQLVETFAPRCIKIVFWRKWYGHNRKGR